MDCHIIDCGDIDKLIDIGWHIKGVLLTHVHTDHIYGLNKLIEVFPDVQIFTNEYGKRGLQNPRWNLSHYHYDVEDIIINKLDNVRVIDAECQITLSDGISVDVIFTPGHDPSCISYKIDNCLYTGDSYIPGVKVVTTFPKSNKQQAENSLMRLQGYEKEGVKIMPGHWLGSL